VAAALEGFDNLDQRDLEEETEQAAPISAPVPGATEQPVSAQALNGAQIASLLEILAAVAAGAITPDAGIALIGVAFPSISEEAAREIVAGARAVPESVDGEEARTLIRSMLLQHGIGQFDAVAKWLVLDGKGEPETRDLESEEGRTAVWRGFIERVHGPSERKMALTMRRYLRAQASRIAKRLAKEMGTKGITKAVDDRVLDRILDEAYEGQQLLTLFRPIYRDTIAKAFEEASRSIRADLTIDPDELDRQALLAVREMKGTILKTTEGVVRDVVNKGLAEDWTLSEFQSALTVNKRFSAAEAMMIARTETTRHSNRAAVDSFKKAEETGLKIEKMWLSARDGKVRDAHKPQAAGGLDGQTVPVDGVFTYQSSTTEHPGGFGIAAQDINCRCTVVAKVVN
jgi:hypothetical protein